MDAKSLWKKSLMKAATSPGNVISGAVTLAASAALWNPLPLILWTLGSAGWTLMASTSKSLQDRVLEEERRAREAQIQAEREAQRQKVEASLEEQPVAGWIRRGTLPDYMQVFRRLQELRERVARLLRERSEREAFSDTGILGQLDYMLASYLGFVREHLVYLVILSNLRAGGPAPEAGAAKAPTAVPPPPPPAGFPANRWERVARPKGGQPKAPSDPVPEAPPSVEQRLKEIDDKTQRLRELARTEPATARTREWHVGILQKQRELLLECQKRDQCVVAQLGAFLDVFEVIVGRVSASQFSATEIASYMGGVVQQIEETERLVASLQPAMDELLVGIDPALNRWSASA